MENTAFKQVEGDPKWVVSLEDTYCSTYNELTDEPAQPYIHRRIDREVDMKSLY